VDRKKEIRAEFERVAFPQLSYLYTSAFYLTKDRADAEDLVQEIYLRAFRFFDKFQPGTNFRAWLLSILQNLFINRYRQKRREATTAQLKTIDEVYESMVEQDENMGGDDPEHHFVSQMMDDEVEMALRGLPEDFRTAIVLVDIEELTYEESANIMECPMGTVRSRVSRGRRMLQVALKEYDHGKGRVRE
jgi:RNA polymerase sigma-70 factor (ECF subfamily)